MNIDDYTEECCEFCVYPSFNSKSVEEYYYLAGLLAEEVGEILSVVNKAYRKGQRSLLPEQEEKLDGELGDAFWALCQLCRVNGLLPSMVVDMNVTKLRSRMDRGVINGEGDNR